MERKYNRGIDYSLGKANFDPNTGIRYGVISINELSDWAFEEFEPDYGEPSCPDCGGKVWESKHPDQYYCTVCTNFDETGNETEETEYIDAENIYPESPNSWNLDQDGYQAQQHEDNDIFVFRSPYYTHASFCSPCAPGACYLTNPCPEGDKAYCFGHDWFEGGKAPYPVYRVDTDELVNPEEN